MRNAGCFETRFSITSGDIFISVAMEEGTGLPRSSKPHGDCHAFIESLERAGKNVLEDCPVCFELGIGCRVACHPSASSAGKLFIRYVFIAYHSFCAVYLFLWNFPARFCSTVQTTGKKIISRKPLD